MREEQRDQRAYLKVKIKSLAEEARIIRKEEQRCVRVMTHSGWSEERAEAKREGLHNHRVGTVRRAEARHSLLAYGFIRGQRYRQMEAKCETAPMWPEVFKMAIKYGLQDYGQKGKIRKLLKRKERDPAKEELLKRFDEWKSETIS